MNQSPQPHQQTESVVAAASQGYAAERAPLHAADGRSVGEVLGDISASLSTLLQQEVTLAKAEVRESATRAGRGVGLLVGTGLAVLMLLVFLSTSAWWGLGQFLGNEWSALVVAGVWAVIALILGLLGRAELQRIRGVARTTETLRDIPNAITGHEEKNR